MEQKIENIKERILYFAKSQGISYEAFCADIGMSYGNFKGRAKKRPLNSDAIANIMALYPDVSPRWLLTGKGNMMVKETSVDELIQRKVEKLMGEFQGKMQQQQEKYNILSENFNTIFKKVDDLEKRVKNS